MDDGFLRPTRVFPLLTAAHAALLLALGGAVLIRPVSSQAQSNPSLPIANPLPRHGFLAGTVFEDAESDSVWFVHEKVECDKPEAQAVAPEDGPWLQSLSQRPFAEPKKGRDKSGTYKVRTSVRLRNSIERRSRKDGSLIWSADFSRLHGVVFAHDVPASLLVSNNDGIATIAIDSGRGTAVCSGAPTPHADSGLFFGGYRVPSWSSSVTQQGAVLMANNHPRSFGGMKRGPGPASVVHYAHGRCFLRPQRTKPVKLGAGEAPPLRGLSDGAYLEVDSGDPRRIEAIEFPHLTGFKQRYRRKGSRSLWQFGIEQGRRVQWLTLRDVPRACPASSRVRVHDRWYTRP